VSFVLRDAVPADVPVLLGFARGLAAHEGRPEAVTATEADLHAALFGTPPRGWALVAERDGAAVGFAAWSYRYVMYRAATMLYVTTVFVDEAARGGGTGRAIFGELARRALREGCLGVDWGVREDNATALAFYASIGAERRTGSASMTLRGEALERMAAWTSQAELAHA